MHLRHLKTYNGATTPNHSAAGFSQNCATCHTTVQWKGATFNHGSTRFALTGAHVPVACQQCHVGRQICGYFDGMFLVPHGRLQQDHESESCHFGISPGLQPVSHHRSVEGGLIHPHHRQVPADRSPRYGRVRALSYRRHLRGTTTACISCHLKTYNGTTTPNHPAAGFSQNCTTCHTTVQWKGATFNHGSTRFPLTGAHVPVDLPAVPHRHSMRDFHGMFIVSPDRLQGGD